MSEINILPLERWQELAEIYAREFDAGLPDENNSQILFKSNKSGKITSFVTLEMMLRVGQFYSDGTKPSMFGYTDYLIKNFAPGTNAIVIASGKRFEPLCRRFGMREIEGKIFRRDF